MKQRHFLFLLVILAVLLAAFRLTSGPLAFAAAAAFPFEQLGLLLRALSLTGRFGNAAALALYAALCLLPVFLMLLCGNKRKLCAEDALLPLVSVLLFLTLYWMTNPGKLSVLGFPLGQTEVAIGSMLGICIYSVLAGYAVLRVLRLAGDAGRMQRLLRALLMLTACVFVWAIFYAGVGELSDSLRALKEGNTGRPADLGPSAAFLVLGFLLDALAYVLDIVILFFAMRLVDEMQKDHYAQAAVNAAQTLARFCTRALAALMLANIGFNLAQLACAKWLFHIDSTLQLPVFSALFALAALLLARMTAENRTLKQDSDLII